MLRILHCMPDLLKLRPQLRGRHRLQALQLGLI